MKWTKHAGLVSCNTEARLINKLNDDLEREKAKKHVKTGKKRRK